MTLIELLYTYAYEVYHYGREQADENLIELGVDKKIICRIQESVDNDGDFISADEKDPVFIPWGWKKDIYRPNDSRRPPIHPNAKETDPRLN